MRIRYLTVLFLLPLGLLAQSEAETKLQSALDSLREVGNFPGIMVSMVLPNGTLWSFSSGYSNTRTRQKITARDYLMQGSVGKTYCSAIALQLIQEGKLKLDEKASGYLGDKPWFSRLPNAPDITVRMLMNHTSGIMRYEFKEAFTQTLSAQPDKSWTPEELLSYVLDEKAPFKAGEGWDYSDTNYIVLGLIIEKITGRAYYDLVRERLLEPFKLPETRPSSSRTLPGLIQGYAGTDNPFGFRNEVVDSTGRFIINPQFEWTGGGIYSTTNDLARWGKLLYEGRVFDKAMLTTMLDGVPAKLGKDTRYGLGVIIRQSADLGTFYGHSGFFPGYLAELYYFPSSRLCVALQTNSSDFKSLKISDLKVLVEMARRYGQITKN